MRWTDLLRMSISRHKTPEAADFSDSSRGCDRYGFYCGHDFSGTWHAGILTGDQAVRG